MISISKMCFYMYQNTPNRLRRLYKSYQSRLFLPVSSATNLCRVDVLSYPIKDYFGFTNIEGMMDATIRVNYYSGKTHQ